MSNLQLQDVEFKETQSRWGQWREYLYESGMRYREFKSNAMVLGMPLLHYTHGVHPATGKRTMAKGFVAVGSKAYGIIAIGQLAIGIIAVGQFALGALLGLGQFAAALWFGLGQYTVGCIAIGQFAAALWFGLGQFTVGYIAIGQFACGYYVLAQMGLGVHVWSMQQAAPSAVELFRSLPVIGSFLSK